MKTKHILTALALPTVFAACTADDIVGENNAMQQAERAKLSKDFVLDVNNGVESRYAVEGSTSLDFVFEEGDLIGANLIDAYDASHPGFKADDPSTWKIVNSVAPALPFENVNGVWKSAGELGVGNYLFTNPYNPADKSRSAAKYELPVVVKYDAENPNAHIEAYNKAVAATILREDDTEASINLKNIFTYPKIVVNFDKNHEVTKVDKIILKKESGFIVKGALNHQDIVKMFDTKAIESYLKSNKDKTEADYWAQFETTDFVVDGDEQAGYANYAKIVPSSYVIYEMDQKVVDNSFEVRLILPSIANLKATEATADQIWMYIVTDKGGYKIDLTNHNEYTFKSTTLEAKVKKALTRNSSNTLKVEKPKTATTQEMNSLNVKNIVSDVEDWNALVAEYGDLEKYSAAYNATNASDKAPFEVNIINSDFALTAELDMPSVAEFIIKSDVRVEGDVTLKNIKVDGGKLILSKGATLTTDMTFKADQIDVEEGAELIFAAEYNKKNELVAYKSVKKVCNHGIVTIPTGVIAEFELTNAKDAVVNVGSESRAADDAVANLKGTNYGIINNYSVINVYGELTNSNPIVSTIVSNGDEELAGYEYNEETKEWDGVPTINNFGTFNAKNKSINNGLFVNNGVVTSSFVGEALFNNLSVEGAKYTATLEIAKNAETYIDTNASGLIVLSELNPAKFTIHNAKDASSYDNAYYGTIKYTLNDKAANTVDLSTSPVTYLVTNVGINLTKTYNYMATGETVATVKALPTLEVNGGEVKVSTTKNTATTPAYVAQVTNLIVNGETYVGGEIASVENITINNDAVLGVPAGAKLSVANLNKITTVAADPTNEKEAGKMAVNGGLHLTGVSNSTGIYGTTTSNENIVLHKGVQITCAVTTTSNPAEGKTMTYTSGTLHEAWVALIGTDTNDFVKSLTINGTIDMSKSCEHDGTVKKNSSYTNVFNKAVVLGTNGSIINLTKAMAVTSESLTVNDDATIQGTANLEIMTTSELTIAQGATLTVKDGWLIINTTAVKGQNCEAINIKGNVNGVIAAKNAAGEYLFWNVQKSVWVEATSEGAPENTTVTIDATSSNLKDVLAANTNAVVNLANFDGLTGKINLNGNKLVIANRHINSDLQIENGTIEGIVYVKSGKSASFKNITFKAENIANNTAALEIDGGASEVMLENCKFLVKNGYPIMTGYNGSTNLSINACEFTNYKGNTKNPYINPIVDGNIIIKDSKFDMSVTCEVEGKEANFEITGNTFNGTFGIATAKSVKADTQAFLNSVLDNNTFNGENKIEVYRIDNGKTYYFNEKF